MSKTYPGNISTSVAISRKVPFQSRIHTSGTELVGTTPRVTPDPSRYFNDISKQCVTTVFEQSIQPVNFGVNPDNKYFKLNSF